MWPDSLVILHDAGLNFLGVPDRAEQVVYGFLQQQVAFVSGAECSDHRAAATAGTKQAVVAVAEKLIGPVRMSKIFDQSGYGTR